jgi:hypothetical protein
MTQTEDERKVVAEQALQNIATRVNKFVSASAIKDESLLDKQKFIELLHQNFDRIDKDSSLGISRPEIMEALSNISDYSADEYMMLLLLMRYFDFIVALVDDDSEEEKVISRADVDTLAAFLLHSDMSLEALCQWCSAAGDGGASADGGTGAGEEIPYTGPTSKERAAPPPPPPAFYDDDDEAGADPMKPAEH